MWACTSCNALHTASKECLFIVKRAYLEVKVPAVLEGLQAQGREAGEPIAGRVVEHPLQTYTQSTHNARLVRKRAQHNSGLCQNYKAQRAGTSLQLSAVSVKLVGGPIYVGTAATGRTW